MVMYKTVPVILISLLLLAQTLGGCGPSGSPELQKTVDALRSLRPTDIPEHLEEYNCVKTGEEFDINEYFSLLTHLSMEEGYILDYVYLYNWMFSGRPIIYVRKADQEPFLNYEEYNKARELNEQVENVYDFVALIMYGDSNEFDNKIIIDGTKEGFFEYVVLQLMGGQFYLYWHAHYDDARIICDITGFEAIEEEHTITIIGGDVNTLPYDFLKKARKLNYKPVVKFKDDVAIVTVMVFTKWGGLIRDSFTISRDFPHTIVDRHWKVIVEYDCGIEY